MSSVGKLQLLPRLLLAHYTAAQPDTSLHCKTTDMGYSASRSVPLCLFIPPTFAGTRSTYPRRDGQAELTWATIEQLHTCPRPNTVNRVWTIEFAI